MQDHATPEVAARIRTLEMGRKVISLDSVPHIDPTLLTPVMAEDICSLPEIFVTDPEFTLLGTDLHTVDDWYQSNEPTLFILILPNRQQYLVDTQGYSYCRYVLRPPVGVLRWPFSINEVRVSVTGIDPDTGARMAEAISDALYGDDNVPGYLSAAEKVTLSHLVEALCAAIDPRQKITRV